MIADKKEEVLEIVDENGVSTKEFATREYVHKNHLFHNEVALWIIDKDSKQVLVQRRSKFKKQNPNKIALCAGHVVAGETIIEGLRKEAFEEIGVDIDKFDVKEILRVKSQKKNNYCFSYHYCILKKIPIKKIKIQEEELSEVFYMDYEKLKAMIKNSDPEVAILWTEEVARLFAEIDKIIY